MKVSNIIQDRVLEDIPNLFAAPSTGASAPGRAGMRMGLAAKLPMQRRRSAPETARSLGPGERRALAVAVERRLTQGPQWQAHRQRQAQGCLTGVVLLSA
jgi:hypothetical protein